MDFLDGLFGKKGEAKAPPLNKRTIADIKAAVELERGKGYVGLVTALLAHYNGRGKDDTKAQLAITFPNSHGRMVPVTLPVLRKLVHERAQVFGGEGEALDWLPDVAGDEEPEPDENFAQAVDAAGLRALLREVDRRVEFCGRVFVRATWDGRDERVRVSLFTPDRTHPRFPADTRDLDAATVVFDVEPVVEDGKTVTRWEVWDAERAAVIDERDRIDGGETKGLNPYRYDDGAAACVPVVSFAAVPEDVAGYWPSPREDWLDTQRAVNTDETSRAHLARVAGFGVWVSTSDSKNAEPWPEKTEIGADVIVEAPAGRTFDNKFAQVDLAGLSTTSREHLQRVTSLNDLPPGSVLAESRTVPSGAALAIERAPLMEAREDRVDAYRVPLARLAEVIRVVHNHHCAKGLEIPPGKLRWTPGDVTPPPDPEAQRRVDEADIRMGVSSAVRLLMRDHGLTREAAIVMAREIEEEKRLVSARPAVAGGVSPFATPPPSPLAGTSLLPDDNEEEEADE